MNIFCVHLTYFNMWHVMHCYWIAQYVHNFGHYHIARKFGGGKLVSWANRPWFAKLKLSKLVLTTKNLLANLLIPQTFFHQKLEKSQFTKLFPAKLSHYTVLSNIYTIDITYLYMCVSVCIYLATNIKEHEIIRLVKVSYVSWHITILQTPANIKWYNLFSCTFWLLYLFSISCCCRSCTRTHSNATSHYYGPIALTTAKPMINVTGPVKRDQVNTKHIIS